MFKKLVSLCFATLLSMGGLGMINVSANGNAIPYSNEGPVDGWEKATVIGSPSGFATGSGSQLYYYLQGGSSATHIWHTVNISYGTIANDLWGSNRKVCSASVCSFDDAGSKRKYTFTVTSTTHAGSYVISGTPYWGM